MRLTDDERMEAERIGAVPGSGARILRETMYHFPIGSRVEQIPFGSTPARMAVRQGTVVGYSLDGDAVDKVRSKSCLRIIWDGNRKAHSLHRSHVMRIPEIALRKGVAQDAASRKG